MLGWFVSVSDLLGGNRRTVRKCLDTKYVYIKSIPQ
jgi:hypothetical protein